MKVSEYFSLGRNQSTLDFVDVDIKNDIKLFIDPRAFLSLEDDWAEYCVALIQDFFQTVLTLVKNGEHSKAVSLLSQLREPNETHLGLSTAESRGTALGDASSEDIWEKLASSEAVSSGLIEDLEDTLLLIPGISLDRISDMTTNIIKDSLIIYTHEVCAYYQIPLTQNIDSGPIWDMEKKKWYNGYIALPTTPNGKLLFVPKSVVRKSMDYDYGEYYTHFILNFLRDKELKENSGLVTVLKSGRRVVYKKNVAEKYGSGKEMIAKYSKQYPQILESYRRFKESKKSKPLSNDVITNCDPAAMPNWEVMISNLKQVVPGRKDAAAYEDAVEKILTALFYPSLTSPKVQHEIHNGRKRIDITYINTASDGFFAWLGAHYKAPYIFIECKNYQDDPTNPEIDQLSGRFSKNRGRVGLLICRNIKDKPLLYQRCKDTANDGRGFIIPLDDNDIETMINENKDILVRPQYSLLKRLFDNLVL